MLAFVFPGQGSQRPGMGRPWVDHPSWEVVADASSASGRDLGRLLLEAGAEELTETRNAQLATLTLSLVVLDAVERLGIEPTACAGHSLGEYTALVASGTLGFEDSVRLVAERGEAMQAAADERPGIMVVLLGCDADTAEVACRLADGEVWVANHNSDEETVVAGDPAAVARAAERALALGSRGSRPVAAGGAFHTPFMAPARERLRKALSTTVFHPPEVPVVANVDALPHSEPAEWPLLLTVQLCSPVRWRQSVLRLGSLPAAGSAGSGRSRAGSPGDRNGAEHLQGRSTGYPEGGDGTRGAGGAGEGWLFVELGAGDSLCTLIRQTLPGASTMAVASPDDLDRLVDAVARDPGLHAFAADHQGEHLYVSERLVISPAAGVYEPTGPLQPGSPVEVGALLGNVSGTEVRSAFAGRLMGLLAHPGERVQPGQPIAWLHAAER